MYIQPLYIVCGLKWKTIDSLCLISNKFFRKWISHAFQIDHPFDWKPERESRNICKFMLNNASQFVSIKTNIVNLFQYLFF